SGLFVRHYLMDVSGWTSVSGTTEDFWDGSSYHYYPAVAVNPWNEVALTFTRSSTAEYAGAHWTLKPQDEGAFLGDQSLHAGEAYYGTGPADSSVYRWGDYSGAAIDPVSGGMWFVTSFAAAGLYIGTWVGYVNHAVFVDAGYFFLHTGSRTFPWMNFL